MDYTNRILHDLECNYVDLSKKNASDIILDCINKPIEQKKNNKNDETVEGFAADYSSGGVSYVPNGDCPVGYKRIGNECHQVCRSCNYIDKKQIEKKLYSELSKEYLNEDAFDYLFNDMSWDSNQDEFVME